MRLTKNDIPAWFVIAIIHINPIIRLITTPRIMNIIPFDDPFPSASSWIMKRSLVSGIRAFGKIAFIR